MIVDAHSHVFPRIHGQNGAGPTRGTGYGRALIGGGEIQITPPMGDGLAFSPEQLLANLDWGGVEKAVLLQGPLYGECNQYALEALRRYSDRLSGAAYFDPWLADSRQTFESTLASPGFCAVKMECSVPSGLCGIHPEAQLGAPELDWLWQELERRSLVLVLDLGGIGSRSYQTEAVRSIAVRQPGLTVVIAHLGQPRPEAELEPNLWRLWEEQVDLGLLSNVWFDCASLIAFVQDEGYPFPSAERYLRLAIERIGAHKVMWGTDQPGTLLHATYNQYVLLAKSHTAFLSPGEQAQVLGETALQIYG
ncbi:MAG: amidohydrolase [Caldilineaceae bacterium SB0664_bin_27]|uniref:Amidohydrolase n=1 Tax=Caldilineaceae bacterium SB0664_bin_27 TaxID=2605260 RepID=A0A6B0YQL7_9CHLR|nr:amidohydrolase [Caldilineaceae bacterium SB0664_bin_27]